jgi:uroporphyrinogen decarboxylase
MTPRDMVLSQVHHCETRPVPYTLSFEGDVADRLDAHYGGKQWRDRLQTFIEGAGVVDTMKKDPTDREGYQRDPYGSTWRLDRRPFHLESPALAAPSFDGYRWPAPEAFYADKGRVAEAKRFCEEAKRRSFVTAWVGWGLFETSWGIRGFENALMDVVAEPDFYEALLDRITDQFLAYIDFTCRHLPDVDAIMFGDDWGDQRGVIVGPERWRRLLKPRYARIYKAVHGRGKLVISHCCGSIVDIMPDIIEIGLDVLESVQPEARGMNPYALKKNWGDKITFWGCLGSQSTIPLGTPERIRGEVKRLCDEMGSGGGFILAPAKALQPETPTQNAVAIVEAFTSQT